MTKIIATLGPASEDRETIEALIAAGMDVARLNFSHGDHDWHRRTARRVREAADAAGRPVALLQDIQGPKIRVGTFAGGKVKLEAGSQVVLRPGSGEAGEGEVLVDYDALLDDLAPGQQVLISDGRVRLRIDEVAPSGLTAVVLEGGVVKDRKGAAFPGAALRVEAVTDKDREDLAFGRELDVDYVAASFVRSARDIRKVAALAGEEVPIIAKVELAAAYENLRDVLQASHGAMVARGDLGVEMELERLPRVQEEILTSTNRCGDISITATEMLESMTTEWRPTRAEVTDVASAVLAGTDAVMLSGETAVGRHPARVVQTMDRICREVESGPRHRQARKAGFLEDEALVPSATSRAAVEAAVDLDLETIIAFTESGSTARLLSKYRPGARVVAFTPEPSTYRRMALYWGVEARLFERFDSTDDMLQMAERQLVAEGVCSPGETVVMVAGIPPNQKASTNFMKLHEIASD